VAGLRQQTAADREFTRALANSEFELYFQPVASITSGEIEALEALVRWRHPDEGLLAPSTFLSEIERSPNARLFTHHILESALRQAAAWTAAGKTCRVAVNVSAHMVNHALADDVRDLLAETRVPPHLLILEVTESAVMDDPIAATRALDQLARLGIGGVAIDDFGTGHSSLGRLRDLPLDALKIDRSFVAELDRGVDPAFVRSVIDLAHHLALRVVAEGIEDEQSWRCLARLGCDAGQGYWLSPPLSADAVIGWLDAHDAPRLAEVGVAGEGRPGAGGRALGRLAGAFEHSPEPTLLSDPRHRWVLVNAAARDLLQTRTILERHIDDTVRDGDGGVLSKALGELDKHSPLAGTCEVRLDNGETRQLHYQLRRSFIPEHYVWVLSSA